MKLIVSAFFLFGLIYFSKAQSFEPNWIMSISFSYGSENNIGNPGFMLTNEIERMLSKKISVSGRVGFFHSMPWFNPPDSFYGYSSLIAGAHINHSNFFNKGQNFVKVSAGLDYVHSYEFVAFELDQNGFYNSTTVDPISKFGYGLSLEGGGKLSEKASLSLIVQIYSFQIFADIFVIGPKIQIKL